MSWKNTDLRARLGAVECRQSTDVANAIFWDRSSGSFVWDVEGKKYFDLTSGFSVCNLGHNPSWLTSVWHQQIDKISHVLGDVSPSVHKVSVLERLTKMFGFEQGFLGVTGSDAVEFALKTAMLMRPLGKYFVVFEGSYHGLSAGALSVTSLSPFSDPFLHKLFPRKQVVFPQDETGFREAENALKSLLGEAFAVIVEPIQGRAGERFPHPGFMPALGDICKRAGTPLIIDEIYTGFYRTGKLRASPVQGDLLCLGKALGNGMPVSAVLGSREVFQAWPQNMGEALHTGTFMGHALALAGADRVLQFYEEHSDDLKNSVHGIEKIAQEVLGSSVKIQGALGRVQSHKILMRALQDRGIFGIPCGTGATGIGLCPSLLVEQGLWKKTCESIREIL